MGVHGEWQNGSKEQRASGQAKNSLLDRTGKYGKDLAWTALRISESNTGRVRWHSQQPPVAQQLQNATEIRFLLLCLDHQHTVLAEYYQEASASECSARSNINGLPKSLTQR